MTDATTPASKTRRVIFNATKLAMLLAIIGLGVQAGIAFFDSSDQPAASEPSAPESDPGAWTFAGEGLSVAVRAIEAGDVEKELLGTGEAGVVDPSIAKGEAESGILELLAAQPPTFKGAGDRRAWRQTISGIEVYAETCKSGGIDRLAVARAAWSTTGTGLTLLEIRPSAESAGNEKSAGRLCPVPNGATEMAKRVTSNGAVTGSLMTTRDSLEAGAKAMNDALVAAGWTVTLGETSDEVSAKTMACERGKELMQVVLFRQGEADQTMILCVRD